MSCWWFRAATTPSYAHEDPLTAVSSKYSTLVSVRQREALSTHQLYHPSTKCCFSWPDMLSIRILTFLFASSILCFAASVLFLISPEAFLTYSLSPLGIYEKTTGHTPSKGWNLLYHLGGNSPWIPKIDGIVDGGIDPPKGCTVDMVHMVQHHGSSVRLFSY